MANSKHAHFRYNVLDYCFRNKAFTFSQLLEYVNEKIAERFPGEGIQERILRKDIAVFKDPVNGFGAPFQEMSRIYKYTNTNFSIAKRPILENENYLIEAAQQILERFENHPKYDKLAEALIKFQDEENQQLDTNNKVLFYDQNEEYKGIKYLKPLYLAIQKKQVLQITFKGFEDVAYKTFEFHPHILKQYNRRWFVFGYNKTAERWRHSIPLDARLVNFSILDDVEYIESTENWDNHFRNLVGVRRNPDDKLHFVKLKFQSVNRLNLFRSKPFLPDFDDSIAEGEENVVHFEAFINPELVQQVLSYGKDVEVLEPKELIERLKEHSFRIQEFYNK